MNKNIVIAKRLVAMARELVAGRQLGRRHLQELGDFGPQMLVQTTCPLCHGESTMMLDRNAFEDWESGKLIQQCFPDLSDEEREQLMSGTCPKCWKKMYNQ